MAIKYVADASVGGTNVGTLSNPFLGWSGIKWAELELGSANGLAIIGELTVPQYSSIGSHQGTEGNELYIRGHTAQSKIVVPGTFKTLFVNRSNTVFENIQVDGMLTIDSPATSYPATGYNIKFGQHTTITSGGITLETFSEGDRRYGKIALQECVIRNATRGIYMLGTGANGTPVKTIRIDGLKIEQSSFYDIVNSGIELRFEGPSRISADSYINDFFMDDVEIERVGSNAVDGGMFIRLFANNGQRLPQSDRCYINNIRLRDDNIGGQGAIGGFAVQGYGKTQESYGTNIISNITLVNSIGQYGLLNILNSRYFEIFNLRGSNISTGTIDGNGLLIDLYNEYIRAWNIEVDHVYGRTGAPNSGCAVMILAESSYIAIWDVRSTETKVGIYCGAVSGRNITVRDSTFNNCTDVGLKDGVSGQAMVLNCEFSSTANTSIGLLGITGSNLIHEYNVYRGFDTPASNTTLTASESTTMNVAFDGNIS